MYDILIAGAVAQIIYPFIALYAWWKWKQSEATKETIAKRREERINGRMDELLMAREQIAHEAGRKLGMAEGILIGQRGR